MPFFPSWPHEVAEDAIHRHIFAMNPKIFAPWLKVEGAVMRGDSAFTPGERELIGGFTSRLNDCTVCASTHGEAAVVLGVDPAALDGLMQDIDTAPVRDALKPVFHFVRKLTLTPYRMVQSDADKVFAAGWSERDLQDAILVTCVYSFMNRLVDGHGLPRDASIFTRSGHRLATRGYVPATDWADAAGE